MLEAHAQPKWAKKKKQKKKQIKQNKRPDTNTIL